MDKTRRANPNPGNPRTPHTEAKAASQCAGKRKRVAHALVSAVAWPSLERNQPIIDDRLQLYDNNQPMTCQRSMW